MVQSSVLEWRRGRERFGELEYKKLFHVTTVCAIVLSMNDALAVTAALDSDLARDARAFYDALSDLVRVYQFRDRDRICCYDISVSQCYALEALVRRGGMTLNDLAAQLYLDKSTASRVVDALERKGYVARTPIRRTAGPCCSRRPRPAGRSRRRSGGISWPRSGRSSPTSPPRSARP